MIGREPHWESRTLSSTSSKVKNLIKNLIKNQDIGQDQFWLRFSLRFSMKFFFSLRISMRISIRSCPRSWFFMRFLMRFLTFDEVLDEVLDSQWGSCPRPHRDLDFRTISMRFSIRKNNFFPYGKCWTFQRFLKLSFFKIDDFHNSCYSVNEFWPRTKICDQNIPTWSL